MKSKPYSERIFHCVICKRRPATQASKWYCSYCGEQAPPIEHEAKLLKLRFKEDHTYLYFIDSPSDNQIKIGISQDPIGRIQQHRSDRKKPLYFLGFYPGNREIEYALHHQFYQYRAIDTWRHCEWFVKSDEILEFIHLNAISLLDCNRCFQYAWELIKDQFRHKYGEQWEPLVHHPPSVAYPLCIEQVYKVARELLIA